MENKLNLTADEKDDGNRDLNLRYKWWKDWGRIHEVYEEFIGRIRRLPGEWSNGRIID